MTPLWAHPSLALIWLLLSLPSVYGELGTERQAAGPGYRNRNICPVRCGEAGPDAADWYVYHNLAQVQSCPETMFFDFSLYDNVDDAGSLHRIHACTSFGTDWETLPDPGVPKSSVMSAANATYRVGWWTEGGFFDAAGVGILAGQMRDYLSSGYAATNKTVLLYSQLGQATVSLYIGKGLDSQGTGSFALQALEHTI